MWLGGCSSDEPAANTDTGGTASQGGAGAQAGSAAQGGTGVPLRSLCGQGGEPCCVPPLRACALGYGCNASAGLCEARPGTPDTVRTCNTASDCTLDEGCCPAGFLSTCAALGPAGECPLPDLSAIIDADFPDVSISRVESGECAAGCMSPGRHRLLQFAQSLAIVNNGAVDVLFGGPGMPGVQELPPLADCRSISYVEGLVRFELLGVDGTISRAADATFAPGCFGAAQAPFDCWFLGIPKGTASRALVCDQVLLDGVPPGDYVLRVTVDPGDRIPERDEMNNVRDYPFELVDPDPLGECTWPRPDVDSPALRECGWTPSLTAVCDPGESILLGCPRCEGDPVLRVCPGGEVCVSEEAIAYADDRFDGNFCPEVQFDCPQAGRYATFTSSVEPGAAVACDVSAISSADAGSGL